MSDGNPSLIAARFTYRYRFVTSIFVLALVIGFFARGAATVSSFDEGLTRIGDVSNGLKEQPPTVFDSRMDIWFDEADPAVGTYNQIEDRFVSEDFVMVAFKEDDHPFGVFSPNSLSAIARLSQQFMTIPGVRHVRSLTVNPWIRWGRIEDDTGAEDGLIISDLFEGDPLGYSRHDVIERMIAVLGASRTAKKVGKAAVLEVLGEQANFDDYIGEPRLLGTIINESGTVAAIQLQIRRPKDASAGVDIPELMSHELASNLYSTKFQQAALRGIAHFLRLEAGTAPPTAERAGLQDWINSLEPGEKKKALLFELNDPTRNFMVDEHGNNRRKFHAYDPDGTGGWIDRTDPSNPEVAPPDFKPSPLSTYQYRVGGVPTFELNFEDVGMSDAKFIPLMFLVIAVSLLIVFRKVVGVLAPLAVVFGSIFGMVGFSLSQGNLFNNLTMIAPNMVTAVGIADAIHLVAAWMALRSKYEYKSDLIIEVMSKNALPVLLTSITTAIGFFSLTVSTILPVRMLGTIAGLGTLFAYLLSMSIVPAILSLVPHKNPKQKKPSGMTTFFSEERATKLVTFLIGKRKQILAFSSIVIVVSLVGVSRIEIDSDFRGMFPDDNKVMSEFTWIENHLGGVGDLEIVFEAPRSQRTLADLSDDERQELEDLKLRAALSAQGESKNLSDGEQKELALLTSKEEDINRGRIGVDPTFLGAVAAFEDRLRSESKKEGSPVRILTDLISPLDVLRKMHQVQNENRAAAYRVPNESDVQEEARQPRLSYDEWTEEWQLTPAQTGSNLIAQYYLQYENGAKPGENLSTQLSGNRTHFRMQGRLLQAPTLTLLAAFNRIREIAFDEFPLLTTTLHLDGDEIPHSADMTLSGKMLLNARTMDVFSKGFLTSMSIALMAITILIAIIFRSLRLAVISIVPNILPIAIPLSFFGIFGVALHGPAILVSSIALGVCVDDTIHFFTQFARGKKQGLSNRHALVRMFQESGTAVVLTSIVLMLGFCSLALSEFTPNKIMGYLAVGMIGLALIADLIVAPVLLSLLPEKDSQADEIESENETKNATLQHV